MATYRIQDTTLTGIADAIRAKTDKTEQINVSNMAEEISAIETEEQINNAQIVTAISEDQIQIGDTVYTINGKVESNDFLNTVPYHLEAEELIPSLSSYSYAATFSPDGKILILGGAFTGKAKIYSVNNTTLTYVSDIYADNNNTPLSNTVNTVAFSPDGKILILGGVFTGKAKIYSITGTTLTYISDIYADNSNTALSNTVKATTFSPDGKILILGGVFTGYAKIYSVNGTVLTYISNIYADNSNTALSNTINTAAFSPDGNILMLGGAGGVFSGCAKIYSVNNTTLTYVSDIYADNSNKTLDGTINTAAFSPDGKALVLGGGFSGYAKVYSVSGTALTYISNIYANLSGSALSSSINTVIFSPSGNTLVLGGYFSGYAKVYSVNNTTLTYISDIYADTSNQTLDGNINMAAFSPDGEALVLGGGFTRYAKVYSVSDTALTYISDIYNDNNFTALRNYTQIATFSPDGKSLVLGGAFSGYAKVYSVSGTVLTYISNIYADNNNTALDDAVNTAAFSSDGSILVLGGNFSSYAKIYSVKGTNITYISDIYADNNNTTLNGEVKVAIFSPDNSALVLAGAFSNYAKVYSVSGTTITYINNIYADNNNTTLTRTVNTAAFSPDGKSLVLGGAFYSAYAKIYSVNETVITYVDDIYADNNGTALSNVNAAAFSPDGKSLVLGGAFTGRAKIYSVNGTALTYVSDIYADNTQKALNDIVRTAVFSSNGNTLVLGGQFTNYAKIYSIIETNVVYVGDIYANKLSVLDNYVYNGAFSPDGTILVLGGTFATYAKAYAAGKICVRLAPHGDLNELPSGAQVGFAKTSANEGEEITVKTIGTVYPTIPENLDSEFNEQDTLIADIMTALDGKIASGGGSSVETCTVTITAGASSSMYLTAYHATIYDGEKITSAGEKMQGGTYLASPVTINNVVCGSTIGINGYMGSGLSGTTLVNAETTYFTNSNWYYGAFKVTAPAGQNAQITIYDND